MKGYEVLIDMCLLWFMNTGFKSYVTDIILYETICFKKKNLSANAFFCTIRWRIFFCLSLPSASPAQVASCDNGGVGW